MRGFAWGSGALDVLDRAEQALRVAYGARRLCGDAQARAELAKVREIRRNPEGFEYPGEERGKPLIADAGGTLEASSIEKKPVREISVF